MDDLGRLLPLPDAISCSYSTTVSSEVFSALHAELVRAERNLQWTGEQNVRAATRAISAREAFAASGADRHMTYNGETFSVGMRHAFNVFGRERPATMVILTDGVLDDPTALANYMTSLDCSPQNFPTIYLGIIGPTYQVNNIEKTLRQAIIALSRRDVPFRVHDLVKQARLGKEAMFGESLVDCVTDNVADCSVPIPEARKLRVKSGHLVLPDGKYCRPGRIAHALMKDHALYCTVRDYITTLFVEDDLSGLTASNSAASVL
ncbi:MAG: hypothetical protein VX998_02045, partial [Candidatus Thermoplasmatota archaeon]|nr:hypothetical protein [Candidatus Thermoplasmatota archaeon]